MATLAVTGAVKSISQAEALFGLSRSTQPNFFTEWRNDLPALTAGEEAAIARLKASYLYTAISTTVPKNLSLKAPSISC